MLWAAKKTGRPVKWVPDRADAFMTDTQGRDNLTRLELALDEELRFLGLEVQLIANMGAYLSNFAPEIPTASGAVMHSGVYAIPAIHVGVKACSPTPCRSTPIAAPAGPRPPMPSSG